MTRPAKTPTPPRAATTQPRRVYEDDLTDAQWAILEPLLPPAPGGGRPRTTDMREVLNAILYLLRTGTAWKHLPHDFPPAGTVYDYWPSATTSRSVERQHSGMCHQVPISHRMDMPDSHLMLNRAYSPGHSENFLLVM
jgi:transposase